MERRGFLSAAYAAMLGLLLLPRSLKRVVRCVEARRGCAYPGPVRGLDTRAVARPGKWAG